MMSENRGGLHLLARLTAFFFLILLPATFVWAEEPIDLSRDIPLLMAEAQVPGLTLAIIKNGQIVEQLAFGYENVTEDQPMRVESLFEAASNGKVIAAYQVFLLIEAGELRLDDIVTSDRLTSDCGPVTIGELLNHTAGLSNDITASIYVVDCQLRGEFSYAGLGYLLLGELLERQSGVDNNTQIKTSIFHPLGMMQTTFDSSETPLVAGHPDLIFGYLTKRAPAEILSQANTVLIALVVMTLVISLVLLRLLNLMPAVLAITGLLFVNLFVLLLIGANMLIPIQSLNRDIDLASSLKTNVLELSTFAQELMQPTLISSETRDLMFAHSVEVNRRTFWAYGLGVDNSVSDGGKDKITTYWHWGSNPGYQSLMVLDPKSNNAVVILTNGGGFVDYYSETRGGYNLARVIARRILKIDGHWNVSE